VVAKVAPKPAPAPAVAGGRVASGARNVAAVGGQAVEEIGAQGGFTYEEAGVLFRDYAVLKASEISAELFESSELFGPSLDLGSVFQILELVDQADHVPQDPGIQDISRQAAAATEAYRGTQEITEAPTDPVGGNLSLRL